MVHVHLRHAGTDYEYDHWFNPRGTDDVRATARYMYEQGNYACDCNRSLFISYWCDGQEDFPEMECGDTIALVSLAYGPDFIGPLPPDERGMPDTRAGDAAALATAARLGLWIPAIDIC